MSKSQTSRRDVRKEASVSNNLLDDIVRPLSAQSYIRQYSGYIVDEFLVGDVCSGFGSFLQTKCYSFKYTGLRCDLKTILLIHLSAVVPTLQQRLCRSGIKLRPGTPKIIDLLSVEGRHDGQ